MKLGLGSFAYGWAFGAGGRSFMSAHDLILNASAIGLSCVQFGDNVPFHALEAREIERLKQAASSRQIEIQLGARGFTADHALRYLELAREVHSPMLRFVVDHGDYEPSADEVAAIARKLVPSLEGAAVVLAIENHDRFPARILREIVESCDSPWVGVCLDTANSLGAGEGLEHVIEILAPYVVNLHLKNVSIRRLSHLMGFTISGTPAGEGMLDLKSVVEKIGGYGRCGAAIIELWTPPEDLLEITVKKEQTWVENSAEYLKRIVTWEAR